MGTFNLQIDDWNQDPTAAIRDLTAQDEKAGLLAAHGYGIAKALAGLLGAPHASVAGGWIPLPDGTDSITVSIGMQTGASDLAYHERVMNNLMKGPDHVAPVGINGAAGLPEPAVGPGGGRGDAADNPGEVSRVGGTEGPGGADHGTAGGLGPDRDAPGPAVSMCSECVMPNTNCICG